MKTTPTLFKIYFLLALGLGLLALLERDLGILPSVFTAATWPALIVEIGGSFVQGIGQLGRLLFQTENNPLLDFGQRHWPVLGGSLLLGGALLYSIFKWQRENDSASDFPAPGVEQTSPQAAQLRRKLQKITGSPPLTEATPLTPILPAQSTSPLGNLLRPLLSQLSISQLRHLQEFSDQLAQLPAAEKAQLQQTLAAEGEFAFEKEASQIIRSLPKSPLSPPAFLRTPRKLIFYFVAGTLALELVCWLGTLLIAALTANP